MTDAIRHSGVPLDFALGARPRGEEAAAAFRLSDLRRSAAPRKGRALLRRPEATWHVLWRGGIARIREV